MGRVTELDLDLSEIMWCLESEASLETDLASFSQEISKLQPKEDTGKDEMRNQWQKLWATPLCEITKPKGKHHKMGKRRTWIGSWKNKKRIKKSPLVFNSQTEAPIEQIWQLLISSGSSQKPSLAFHCLQNYILAWPPPKKCTYKFAFNT